MWEFKVEENCFKEQLISRLIMIGALGGNAADYLIDKGIEKISIFGLDELAVHFYKQAVLSGIEVSHCLSMSSKPYSSKEINGTILNPACFSETYSKGQVIDELLIICCDYKDFPWGGIKYKSILSLGNLILYSFFKHTIISEVKKITESHPNVQVIFCNVPSVWDIKNKSDYEKVVMSGFKNILNRYDYIYSNAVSLTDYSFEKYAKLVKEYNATFHVENGVPFVNDINGEYVHMNGGYRYTTDIPEKPDKYIYFFGNSACNGYAVGDSETIQSFLQRKLNDKGMNTSVINCPTGGGVNFLEIAKRIEYEPIKDGDAIVIIHHNLMPCINDIYSDRYTTINAYDLFERPHKYGELFIDTQHYTAKANELIADLIIGKISISPFNPQNNSNNEQKIQLNKQISEPLQNYLSVLRKNRVQLGAIVMNCNPFTLGHRYLIEYAVSKVKQLYIFVVEEDKSVFPFVDRFEMVKQGTAYLENVTILPSGEFIISRKTFSEYFEKEKIQDEIIDPSLDVELFATEIAPALGITIRFAGEEPFDKITLQYNDAMRRILPRYGIDFEVIPRKKSDGEVISASRVRKFLNINELEQISKLVPDTTLKYLKERFLK